MSRVKEGQLSEGVLFRLLQTVQHKASSSFPPSLVSLLEEVERNTQEPNIGQTKGKEVLKHFVTSVDLLTADKTIYIHYTAIMFISCWWGNGNCSNKLFNIFSVSYS